MTNINSQNKCRKAYNDGAASRLESPFHCDSSYKIREAWNYLKNDPENLVRMGERWVTKNEWIPINHCMPYEMHMWVRKFPELLCKTLARDVIGAIHGIDMDEVERSSMEIALMPRVKKFVRDAEETRLEVKSNWAYTAKNLKDARGSVYELTVEFLDIVSWVMREGGIGEKW